MTLYDKLITKPNKTVVSYFKALRQALSRRTEENREKLEYRKVVIR
jgi:hypothetical protein